MRLTRGRLWVHAPHPGDTERVQKLVEGRYRRMKTRWGSCRARGAITFNLKLMQVPKPYIDYVIAHELCHLARHNHGPRFYQLLDRVVPDWRERRQGLK